MDSYDFDSGYTAFIMIGLLTIFYEFFVVTGSEVILTIPINKFRNFQDYEMYIKELSKILISNCTGWFNVLDLDKESELVIRGYLSKHSQLCPCVSECPLAAALKSNNSLLDKINKNQ